MTYKFKPSNVVRRYCYLDVSEEKLFNLRKEVVSHVLRRKLSDEEIRKLDSDASSIRDLSYNRRKESYGHLEFFKHINVDNEDSNGRRGHIAYFAREREARVEYI